MNIYHCYNHNREVILYAEDEDHAVRVGWGYQTESWYGDYPVVKYLGKNDDVSQGEIITQRYVQP